MNKKPIYVKALKEVDDCPALWVRLDDVEKLDKSERFNRMGSFIDNRVEVKNALRDNWGEQNYTTTVSTEE